jgi:sec-independent protein translocase protein TatA
MFLGMGPTELIIILVIVLIIFGPKNLPKLGKSLGKTAKAVREGMEEESDDSSNKQIDASTTTPAPEAKVEDVAPAPEPEPVHASAPAETAEAAEGDVKYCPSCGAKNPASNQFCAKCGTKLQ